MKTSHLSLANSEILESCDSLISRIDRLRTATETEKKLKVLLANLTKSAAGNLLVVQDFLINGNDVSDFELLDLIGDYTESIH